jgi:outer membrane protein assembly factor BamB
VALVATASVTPVLATAQSLIVQGSPTIGTVTTVASNTFTDTLSAASGYVAPVTWTQGTGSPQLLVSSSGVVTTSGFLAAGTYTATGTTADGYGDTGTFTYTLTVTAVTIVQGSPTIGTVTTIASNTFTHRLSAASGYVAPVTWIQGTGSPRLLVSSSGKVTTSGSLAAGTYTATGTTADGYGDTGTFTYRLTVTAPVNWTAYLFGPTHSSDNAAALAITTADAASLSQAWNFVPPGNVGNEIYSSPIVYQGNVYIGSENGSFYDLNESTGSVVWSHFTAQQHNLSCGAYFGAGQGFISTATVAPDPESGNPTVYVAAPDGYLYAWNASDGARLWRSVVAIPSTKVNNYFNWSSPTVANGLIYVGVASNCDTPLVLGGEKVYDQSSGRLLATFYTNPSGQLGGDIWSSALVTSNRSVFVSTGNVVDYRTSAIGSSESIIRLEANALTQKDLFTVPLAQRTPDGDFGSSPAVWTAAVKPVGRVPTQMVGACNKNGRFYALRASNLAAGPVWSDQLGAAEASGSPCISSAVWDQATSQLFLSGNSTTINGTSYGGSVQEVNPATGKPIWHTGLSGTVLGTPTLDGSGVLAVATCDFLGAPNAVYLIHASSGQIISTVSTGNTPDFAQPVFADSYLFVATVGHGLLAYQAP